MNTEARDRFHIAPATSSLSLPTSDSLKHERLSEAGCVRLVGGVRALVQALRLCCDAIFQILSMGGFSGSDSWMTHQDRIII